MQAPVVPKRKPVMSRRSPSLGIRRATGVPAPNMRMTSESPTSTSNAVPINSDRTVPRCVGHRILLTPRRTG